MIVRLCSIACLTVLIGNSLELSAGEKERPDFMAILKKFGTPGPEHKLLQPLIGSWKVEVKMYMEPDAKATLTKGQSKREWVLGKRYMAEHYKGNFFGMDFEGMGITGYDRYKKRFVGGWIDSMSTGMISQTGQYNPKTKSFTFTSIVDDASTGGKKQKGIDVIRIISNEEHTLTMFRQPLKGGKKTKFMEIRYTRAQ